MTTVAPRGGRRRLRPWVGTLIPAFFGLVAALLPGLPPDVTAGDLLPPGGNYGIQWGGTPPTARQISAFDLVILDGYRAPPRVAHTLTFGYFSVGEVRKGSPEEAFARRHGLILGTNRDWNTLIVDPRKKVWRDYILGRVFPAYRSRGFSGVFFDTVDSPLILEKRHPRRYPGMRRALVGLIFAAHRRYPGIPVILNRSLWILPTVAGAVSGELFEDFCREYSFRKKAYVFVTAAVMRRDNAFVRIARVVNPHLTVMTLDYGTPRDRAPMRHCFAEARQRGYHPYFTPLHIRKLRTFNLRDP